MKDNFVYVPDIKFAIRLLLKYFIPAIILVHMKKFARDCVYCYCSFKAHFLYSNIII